MSPTTKASSVAKSIHERTLSRVKDRLTDRCAAILLAYRRQCAADAAPTQVRRLARADAVDTLLTTPFPQLILPDAYKLLPAYTLCLIKELTVRGMVTEFCMLAWFPSDVVIQVE
jgi:protein transport protein SEC24